MDFQKLCTFDFFTRVSEHYGYGENFPEAVEKEFKRCKGVTFVDHAAATLFPESAVRSFCEDISSNVYGNPHSHSPSSTLSHDTVERVRYRILQHFNGDPEEYTVIFTSGCTAALKLVAECFPWRPGSVFSYLTDNHTSVVGMRGLTSGRGVTTLPVAPQDLANYSKNTVEEDGVSCQTPHLFSFPAQSNFSGKKYPLSYVEGIQGRRLYPANVHKGKWLVLLDAASYVCTSPLNLQQCQADFIPISFYKMLGFPTGLGALLVRTEVAAMLEKSYFGGGTAAAYLSGEDYYVEARSTSDRFEDGTISFLDVIALNHSFDALHKLTGGMQCVQQHTFGLTRYTYVVLSSLRHGTGRPLAQIYTDGQFHSSSTQGPILNFNLLDEDGNFIGFSQVDRMASLYNIHVRTGCFCNTGACQAFVGISDQQMKRNLQAGHVCGDNMDLVQGQPTGSVRVSFGYMSTFQDCQNFLKFVVECFVKGPVTVDSERINSALKNSHMTSPQSPRLQPIVHKNGAVLETAEVWPTETPLRGQSHDEEEEEAYTLTNIYIYPVKSCGAFEVQQWPVGPQGLLYDRGWMVVNANGVCLSQKREARLCLIKPRVRVSSNQLLLFAPEMEQLSVPLDPPSERKICHSKVCGDRVETLDCGDQAADWLSRFLGQTCRLIRLSPDFTRDTRKRRLLSQREAGRSSSSPSSSSSPLSLVNEAQYLMISRGSVEHIQKLIHSREEQDEDDLSLVDVQNIISRFRANLVVSAERAFEEDNWSHLFIGDTPFTVSGPCSRCHMVGIDQETGLKTKEPLLSLSTFRSNEKVTFGLYLRHQLPPFSGTTTFLCCGSSVRPHSV